MLLGLSLLVPSLYIEQSAGEVVTPLSDSQDTDLPKSVSQEMSGLKIYLNLSQTHILNICGNKYAFHSFHFCIFSYPNKIQESSQIKVKLQKG